MKVFFLISIIFIGFSSTYYCFSNHKNHLASAKTTVCVNDENDVEEKFFQKYEELTWKRTVEKNIFAKNDIDVVSMLRFINGVCYGDYLDYLHLHLKQPEERRITYDQFSALKEKIQNCCDCLIFSYEEFCNVLIYSLILTNIVDSCEYKNKSWIYGTTSLLENIIIHPEIFPSVKQFSSSQMKLVQEVVRVLSDKTFFSLDQNIALLFSSSPLKKMVCNDAIEVAFFVYLAQKAGTILSNENSKVELSSGYLSQLTELERDLRTF